MGGLTKNQVKQALKSIFRVKSWKLLLILLPLLFLTATLLRLDHIGMVDLRTKVLELDETGTDEEITAALVDLQEYTVTHIVINMIEENGTNKVVFGTGPFFLKHQYEKKAKEELAKAESAIEGSDNNPNGNIYKIVSDYCDEQARKGNWGFNQLYVNCMTNGLAAYPEMSEIQDSITANIPPTALYRREFISPVWYPSWAGIAILACLILIVVIIIRLVIWIVLKLTLLVLKKR